MREDLLKKCIDENSEVLRQSQNEPERMKDMKIAHENVRMGDGFGY